MRFPELSDRTRFPIHTETETIPVQINGRIRPMTIARAITNHSQSGMMAS